MQNSPRQLRTMSAQGSELLIPDGSFYLSGYVSSGNYDSMVDSEDAPFQVPAGKVLYIDFITFDCQAAPGTRVNQLMGYADTNVDNTPGAPTSPIPIHKFIIDSTKNFNDSWTFIIGKTIPASKYPWLVSQLANDVSYTAICHLEDV